jgi:hypothetical protein
MVVALLEHNELPWSIMEQIWIRIAIFGRQRAGNDLFCVGSAVFCIGSAVLHIGSGVCEAVCLFSLKRERLKKRRERLKKNTLSKGQTVLDKLRHDSIHRLAPTIDVMRACRLFNYEFVANTPLLALQGELVQLNRLPYCIQSMIAMEEELELYKTLANDEMEKDLKDRKSLWNFWVFYKMRMRHWFAGAEYAALIQPSSGCSERVFAMMATLPSSVLEDRKEASVMIKMNANWRAVERKQGREVVLVDEEEQEEEEEDD